MDEPLYIRKNGGCDGFLAKVDREKHAAKWGFQLIGWSYFWIEPRCSLIAMVNGSKMMPLHGGGEAKKRWRELKVSYDQGEKGERKLLFSQKVKVEEKKSLPR